MYKTIFVDPPSSVISKGLGKHLVKEVRLVIHHKVAALGHGEIGDVVCIQECPGGPVQGFFTEHIPFLQGQA